MTRSELSDLFRNAGKRPTSDGAVSEIVEVKILDARLLLGGIEGLAKSVLADRLTVAREYRAGTVEAEANQPPRRHRGGWLASFAHGRVRRGLRQEPG